MVSNKMLNNRELASLLQRSRHVQAVQLGNQFTASHVNAQLQNITKFAQLNLRNKAVYVVAFY